ncbi:MAG TPA: hypothetical protein VFU02_17390 [Polyangiaceae bacterium]|nr:hypothetical protein [Polyangiaceae bacterium]
MGKMDGSSKLFIGVTSTVALAFSAGCGDPSAESSEAISTIEAAFAQSSCATAAADQTFTGGIDPSIVSPTTYNTCYKGYVVDIHNLNAVYTGPGDTADGRIEVSYADAAITNQATCEATLLRTIVYNCVGPGATSTTGPHECFVLDDQASYGTWQSVFSGQCLLGYDFSGVFAGGSFRVAATARSPSNTTRKVRIGTYRPITIH